MSKPGDGPLAGIRSMYVDYASGTQTVTMADGSVHQQAGSYGVASSITAVCYDLATDIATFTIPGQAPIEADIGLRPNISTAPVVYLDQKDWVSLARAAANSPKIRGTERDAALTVIELAQARKIRLPMSGAHTLETANAAGRWRRDLAAILLRLSRGLQMRNPIWVRKQELLSQFRPELAEPVTAAFVFGYEPEAIWATEGSPYQPSRNLPERVRTLTTRLTWLSCLYDVLTEDIRTENPIGQQALDDWAEGFQLRAEQIRDDKITDPTHLRAISAMHFIQDALADLGPQFIDGVDPDCLASWLLDEGPNGIAQLPFSSRLREVMHHRLRDPNDRSHPHDLNDLLFLTCATTYADVTVGEKRFANYINRAPGTRIHANLAGALPDIERKIAEMSGPAETITA